MFCLRLKSGKAGDFFKQFKLRINLILQLMKEIRLVKIPVTVNYTIEAGSVADPYYFFTDPDSGLKVEYGSGS